MGHPGLKGLAFRIWAQGLQVGTLGFGAKVKEPLFFQLSSTFFKWGYDGDQRSEILSYHPFWVWFSYKE